MRTNATINEGVTLMMQHTTGVANNSEATRSNANDITDVVNYTTIWGTVTSELTIKSGATLTNKGTLEIGGILSGGGGAADASGHTVESYAQITLESNAKINSTGTINCYGYIKDSNTNGTGEVIVESGNVYMPFILRDFKGGSVTYALYKDLNSKHVNIFNEWEMRNIQSQMTIKYNASIIGWANLYAGDQQNFTSMAVVGNTSSAYLQMTDSTYSYIVTKYDEINEVSHIDIYGGAKTNTLNISLEITLVGKVESSSEKVFFPISHYQQITLNKAPNQTAIANYNIGQRMKIMPGSVFKVESGAKLYAEELIIYSAFDPSSYPHPLNLYPAGKAPAEFVVNGSFEANKFGGTILTDSDSTATVKINSSATVTSYEPRVSSGSSFTASIKIYKDVMENANMHLFAGDKVNPFTSEVAIGEYYSKQGGWYSKTANIYYDANGGTLASGSTYESHETGENGYTITSISAANPNGGEHRTFVEWCLDKEGTIPAIGKTIFVNTTVYAKWNYVEYDIVYNDIYVKPEDEAAGFTSNKGANPITKVSMNTSHIMDDATNGPADKSYVFGGWYLDASCTGERVYLLDGNVAINKLETIDGTKKLNLYALWYPHGTQSYTLTLNNSNNDVACEPFMSFVITSEADWDNNQPRNLATSKLIDKDVIANDDPTYTQYFVGWYTGENGTGTKIDTLSLSSFNGLTDLTLYAYWTSKTKLEVSYKLSNENPVKISDYYYIPSSNNTKEISYFLGLVETELGKQGIVLGDVSKSDKYVLTEWQLSSGNLAYNATSLTLNGQTKLTAIIKKLYTVKVSVAQVSLLNVSGKLTILKGFTFDESSKKIKEKTSINISEGGNGTLYVVEGSNFEVFGSASYTGVSEGTNTKTISNISSDYDDIVITGSSYKVSFLNYKGKIDFSGV